MSNNWLVGICNTDGEGVTLRRVCGTKDQVKEYLARLVNEDKDLIKTEDPSAYDTEDEDDEEEVFCADDVEEDFWGCLQASATYSTYHIDYTAAPEKDPIVLP